MVKQTANKNSFLQQALKLSAEKRAKSGKGAVVWTDAELTTLKGWIEQCKTGPLSKAVLVEMAKQHRKAGEPIEGIGDDKSPSAIKNKLDELYAPSKQQA